jgi:hypothetical protein
MHDEAISKEDRLKMAEFVVNTSKLTAGNKVKEFEKQWSEWLGVKHSVFVNSGSSANLILVQAALDLYGSKNWAAQSCTWSTNITPIMQLSKNCGLYLTDTNLQDLGPNLDDLEIYIKNYGVKYIFLTHVLGFPAISERLLSICKNNDNSYCFTLTKYDCRINGKCKNKSYEEGDADIYWLNCKNGKFYTSLFLNNLKHINIIKKILILIILKI